MSANQREAPRPRPALRIGIIHGERLVEERLVTAPEVTLGPTGRDTFVVPPIEGRSGSVTLFSAGPEGYFLHLDGAMEGRFTVERASAVQGIRAVFAQLEGDAGGARRGCSEARVPVAVGGRGKVVMGDLKILFQVIERPAIGARPQLPPSLRGSIRQNLDWIMLTIAAVSVIGHAGFVAYVRELDLPRRPDIEDLTPRTVSILFPDAKWNLPKPEPPKTDQPKVDPNAVAKPPRSGPPRNGPRTPAAVDPEETARRNAERLNRLHEEMGNRVQAMIIGARGEGGIMKNLLANGGISGDADAAFKGAGGIEVADGTGRTLAPRGTSTGRVATAGGIRGVNASDVETGDRNRERAPECPHGVCGPPPQPIDPEPGCDPKPIAAELSRRRRAFTTCFERVIKSGQTGLKGKLVLHLSIGGAGRVTSATLDEDTVGEPLLSSCVLSTASHWVFPMAGECSGMEFAFPIVFQQSAQ